ncbi:MAG: hypothetical protein R3Y11_01760 [Pseudomonadota bacterium]
MGSSGGSTTDTVDEAYNARMATLSEEQQDWARSYYEMWDTYEKPYEIAQAQANLDALPLESSLYMSQLELANDLMPLQAEAARSFMQQATEGVDVNEQIGLAKSDVANSWADVTASSTRNSARMGINANSGAYSGIQASLDTAKAAQLAGAATTARTTAEETNYSRLQDAASYSTDVLQGI